MEESRVLIWHRDKLKLTIITDQFLQAVFDHILGRDVVKKLMQVIFMCSFCTFMLSTEMYLVWLFPIYCGSSLRQFPASACANHWEDGKRFQLIHLLLALSG
jgi:hypothetical protein